jgi:hypothetical protein
VSKQIIDNNIDAYMKVSRDLSTARLQGRIPWDWVEDRVRVPTIWAGYDSPDDFLSGMANHYQRQVWYDEPCYIEVIIEKDALSGIFSDILSDYRVALNVGRGFTSVTASKEIADRLAEWGSFDLPIHVLTFGDFDPEGLEIPTSLEASLRYHHPSLDLSVKRCALVWDDIEQYQLPPNPAKKGSRLAPKFIEQYGDNTVELDALPIEVLEQRIRDEIEALMDLDALAEIKEREETEREQLRRLKL